MIRILILLILARAAWAENPYSLRLFENPRVQGMGGAFVGVADDPEAGLLNPAGLPFVTQIGNDVSFGAGTGAMPDQVGFLLANPGTQSAASFGAGFVLQGMTDRQKVKYYVPHTGTSWKVFGQTALGLAMRFPYRTSSIDSISSKWDAIGDLSVMQEFQAVKIGAQVERMFGGAQDIVPRRLRAGASMGHPGEYNIAYEWRGTPLKHKYDFHYESSHVGGEMMVKNYVALRGGYVWGQQHRIAMGLAIGLLDQGWRLETGWELPAGHRGETRWSAGFGYRG